MGSQSFHAREVSLYLQRHGYVSHIKFFICRCVFLFLLLESGAYKTEVGSRRQRVILRQWYLHACSKRVSCFPFLTPVRDKNLQLIDVNLYGSSGSAAGIVEQNEGQIIACSVTGKISAYSRTCGIADLNYGRITACWFDGTLKEYESGAIVRYNYNTITSCYLGGNVGQGAFRNHGGTVEATKVDGATVKWQTAVDAMNTALQNAGSEWRYELNGALPTLRKQ